MFFQDNAKLEKARFDSVARNFLWPRPDTRVIVAGVSWTVDMPFSLDGEFANILLTSDGFTINVAVNLGTELTRMSEHEWHLSHRKITTCLNPRKVNRIITGEMYQLLFEAGVLVDESIAFTRQGIGTLNRGDVVFVVSQGKTHLRCVTPIGVGHILPTLLCPAPDTNLIMRFGEPFCRL